MKKQDSDRHLLKKSNVKGEHKSQGEYAKTKSLRSGGDAYAYGISVLMQEAENMKGSSKGFLGVEPELLDPKEYVGRDKLNTKGKK